MYILDQLELCTGCTACAVSCPCNAIEMIESLQGFLYPHIDNEKCIKCNKCRQVCPVTHPAKINEQKLFWAAYNTNTDERESSSSGGIFILLAKCIIAQNGIVYGAAYDDNYKVCHVGIDNLEGLNLLQGAKYSQSFLGKTYAEIECNLKSGRKVLFVGTPCQVAGLKKYLKTDYEGLVLVDMVCHGVPSPKAWSSYVAYRKKQDGQDVYAKSINMRSKITGWSRYHYSIVFKYPSGAEYQNTSGNDLFMKAFVNDLIIRPSCNTCQHKGINRCSDITLGDFWGIWDIEPTLDDDRGTSLVLIHSVKGEILWNYIKNQCVYKFVNEEDTYRQNQSLIKSSPVNKKRDLLLDTIDDSFVNISNELIHIDKQRNIKSSKWYRLLYYIATPVRKVVSIRNRSKSNKW